MIKWIMACVTSTSFSLSINGDIHGYFKGKRGLRQGDPLSPYLFTLVMEVLNLILKRRVLDFDGFRYQKHCDELKIINVCFADDLFIFARSDVDSAKVIMDSLEEFKRVSGLVPSIPKSKLPVKYLGVPLISSRLLNKDCKILMEKAKNRIEDWKNKLLSFSGRLQLCKSVISFMHVYWASVLVIPKGIFLDIQQSMRAFLWCNREYKRGRAKVAWDDICLPKCEGGLGLCSLELFNIALMTTHIWNIVSNKEPLWVRWIHSYKLNGRSLWDIPQKADMSWGWRKILQLRDTVRPYFWVKLGNGKSTSIWFDSWCSICPLSPLLTVRDITSEGFNIYNTVADLVENGAWLWPSTWLQKAHALSMVPAPHLDVWNNIRHLAGMEQVQPVLHDIVNYLQPMANNRTASSIIGRLILAASSYYIWLERNSRIFKKVKKSSDEIKDIIMVTVHLKLLTFKFKNTAKLNFNNAFLYGDLVETVYMKQPEGYFPSDDNKVCRLKKSLYGLKQTPRQWNANLTSALIENGFNQSKSYYSLYTKFDKGIFVALYVYVDDIIITGNSIYEIEKFKTFLKSKFMIKDFGKLKYFLGIEVIDTDKGICFNQRKYVLDLLSEYGMLACDLLKHLCSPSWALLMKLPLMIRLGIHITKSLEAEYRALASVTSEVIWILKIQKDLHCKNLLPVSLYCDSNSTIKIAANLIFHERTKHLEIDLHFVREKILNGVVKTVKVDFANQIADILTKGLDTIQHKSLVNKLGLFDIYQAETKGGCLRVDVAAC
ncbi:ribonuclease H-like domain-containing protein [Tanacetum coccineum]|uniref:Ribonuclease H-like domain-containing protein n=1 Tax=Tanacetum coccineum TaxID=301880 RepID=A0ABQ5EIA3_9ASTR